MDKLENENSYLRKQVKSEIQCKKDLKKALDNQTERLKHARMHLAEKERYELQKKEGERDREGTGRDGT